MGQKVARAIDEAVSSAGLSGSCQGFPATPNLVLDLPDEALRGKVQTLFIQEMARRGVHCYMGFGPTLAHTEEDVCITAEAVEASLRVIKTGGLKMSLSTICSFAICTRNPSAGFVR